MLKILGNGTELITINNPPHILNQAGQMMPSALYIPFCSFGSVLKGNYVSNISFRVCDLFYPVIHNGKLCYQTDIAKMASEHSLQGSGLLLIMDANSEKSVAKPSVKQAKKGPEELDLRKASVETNQLVEINIGTLAQYQAYGPGNYILTSVKKMTASDGFLSMSKEKRKCEKEKFEDCQKRLFQEGVKKCGCTPQNYVPAILDQTQVLRFAG